LTRPAPEGLEPRVEVACTVCGGGAHDLVCSEAEVRAQLAFLEDFHRRRLRPDRAKATEALSDRADFTQDYATDVVSCSRCGLVFRESRPRAGEVTEAYAHDRYGRDRLRALFASQRELFDVKSKRLASVAALPTGARVVEIGSFVGGFLAAARERDWRAVGIDPGEEVAEFCREKGFEVQETTAPEAAIEAGSVDCVAIWNTFDQLPDPLPTLEAARSWLRPGGVLAIRIPNGACFRSAVGRLRRAPSPLAGPLLAALAWNNLLAFPYLHGYSMPTLERLLSPRGFARIATEGDMLTRLADDTTKTWARWEEALSKLSWRALVRSHLADAPWLDAYFRAAPAGRDRADAAASAAAV
jgi:SAM-dependent methyltransferase